MNLLNNNGRKIGEIHRSQERGQWCGWRVVYHHFLETEEPDGPLYYGEDREDVIEHIKGI